MSLGFPCFHIGIQLTCAPENILPASSMSQGSAKDRIYLEQPNIPQEDVLHSITYTM